MRHLLDRCEFLFYEGSDLPKTIADGMEQIDGISGLLADEFIGGGVGLRRVAKEGREHLQLVQSPNDEHVKLSVAELLSDGKNPFPWTTGDTHILRQLQETHQLRRQGVR